MENRQLWPLNSNYNNEDVGCNWKIAHIGCVAFFFPLLAWISLTPDVVGPLLAERTQYDTGTFNRWSFLAAAARKLLIWAKHLG